MKKTSLFRKALSIVLSFAMVIGILFALPVIEASATAAHYSTYNVRIKITVTNDADGWNSASMTVNGLYGHNGNTSNTTTATESDIQSYIDSSGGVYDKTFSFGQAFPTDIDIYTDFGGGVTWRCWEADVTVYVNGVNVKSQHIVAESGAFSSSDTHNHVYIDQTNYPYPVEFHADYYDANDNKLPDVDNFGILYQQSGADACSGRVRISAYDQYGCPWIDYPSITNTTDATSDTASFYDYRTETTDRYSYYTLSSTSGADHSSRYKLSYATGNSVYSSRDFYLDTEFVFLHKADITVNNETVSTIKGYSGSFTDIDVAPPTGYTIRSYSLTGSGTLDYDDTDGTYQYTFGAADGVIKASLKANTYTIAFNGNENTGGNITSKTATYDKNLKLPSNTFSKTGYHFVGWNTQADGSGDSFANLAFVKNLTAVNSATVTLYAQWDVNVYTVNLVYPDGLTEYNRTVEVSHGSDVYAEEFLPGSTDSGHYHLTTAASTLSNITSNRTINLTYEFVDHNYGPQNITVNPTCTTDGEYEEICADCGFVKTTVIPYSHQCVVTHAGYAPTCTETGLSDETYCEACDTVIVAAQTIPALGHSYSTDPIWEWADDYTWAKATWTCDRCDNTVSRQTVHYSEITASDSGPDRVYNTAVNFNGRNYYTTTTYENFYIEVPYVNENGVESTIYAARLKGDGTDSGSAFFVEGTINLTDTLAFTADAAIVLCDGAQLNIETENSGIKLFDSSYYDWVNGVPKYYKDLRIYGQTNQSGELNITVDTNSNSSNGIACGGYYQYGGKVNINCASNDPSNFPGEGNAIYGAGYYSHNARIEIHNGELTAHSDNAEAIFCYHNGIEISGGKVIATTGDSNDKAIVVYDNQGGITLGCRNENDSIYADGYAIDQVGYHTSYTISIADGQTLVDGNGNAYSGTLTSAQVDAIAGKTLTLHSSHAYAATWDWASDLSSATATLSCAGCGDTVTENAAVTSEVTTDETCGEDGVRTYTATVIYDGVTFTDTQDEAIAATGNHTLVHFDEVPATNMETGTREYWQCSVCGKYFADENGQTEISANDLVIPALCPEFDAHGVYRVGQAVIVPEYYAYERDVGGIVDYTNLPRRLVTVNRASNNLYFYTPAGTYVTAATIDTSKCYTGLYTFCRNTLYTTIPQAFRIVPVYYDTEATPEWTWDGINSATVTLSDFYTVRPGSAYEYTAPGVSYSTSVTTSDITCAKDYERGKLIYTARTSIYGVMFTTTKEIDMECDHQFGEPVWTWSSDNSSCTASFTCAVCGEVAELNATVTSVKGNLTTDYTASITLHGVSYSTSKTVARASNIYIGGVHVTCDNASDIFGDGKVSYDETSNTLTLNNATIEVSKYNSTSAFGIRNNQSNPINFNIVLIGENKIVDLVADDGVTEKYGICAFASTPGYVISGSGSLSIEMNATDSSITYYGAHVRKALTVNGPEVSVNIPGTAPTKGIDLMYSDTKLKVIGGGELSVITGSNASTYSVSSNSNIKNLEVESGSLFEASSGNQVFNSNINLTDSTKLLGAFVNTSAAYTASTKWDGETALTGYKYIRIPYMIDINEDGVEDVDDIGFILSASVGNVEISASQVSKADLNGDGVVDAFDAAWLDRYLCS